MNSENKLNLTLNEIFKDQYIIPLYQRNFAWRRAEIEQFLQDIYSSFTANPNGNYYIGSLVTLKRKNGLYEVIDGQQRLTVLSLITKMLGITNKPCLMYDSRSEVESFFKHFYQIKSNYENELKDLNEPQIFHLKEAVNFINEIKDVDEKEVIINLNDENERKKFEGFIAKHVILVRVEVPEDTDVASYFEIMNNRGIQLQKHEILKARLLSKIKDREEDRNEFAEIWDACSQMNVPIQRLFPKSKREMYFGEHYDSFKPEAMFCHPEQSKSSKHSKHFTLEEIIHNNHIAAIEIAENNNNEIKNDDEDESEDSYNSIIDFPNFLMHVLRLFYNKIYNENYNADIPLNEKKLIDVFDNIEKSSDVNKEFAKEFIKNLFHCRTLFDNYILKTIANTSEEDFLKWALKKPRRYKSPKNDTWKYVDTFGSTKDNQSQLVMKQQDRILHALSMLQVTFRTRINKNWLQDLLYWLITHSTIGYEDYIKKIDSVILKNFEDRFGNEEKLKQRIEGNFVCDQSYSEGTSTPHFLFNFIDYLYWVEKSNSTKSSLPYIKDIKDFDFKYWNSVEHHLSQSKAENHSDSKSYIDCLGNLCLISKSINSSLSNRDVKEKVEMAEQKNKGAKRQIMYEMTKKNNNNWGKEQIKEHYNNLVNLLSKRQEILKNI